GLKTFWLTQDPYAIGSENKLDGDPYFFHRQNISLYVGGNVLVGYSYTGEVSQRFAFAIRGLSRYWVKAADREDEDCQSDVPHNPPSGTTASHTPFKTSAAGKWCPYSWYGREISSPGRRFQPAIGTTYLQHRDKLSH